MDFFIENWRFFVMLACVIIEIVLLLVFKRRPQLIDNSILYHLSVWIQEAEVRFVSGSEKLDYVVSKAKDYLGDKFNRENVISLVEYVLSLPQKKEGRNNEK